MKKKLVMEDGAVHEVAERDPGLVYPDATPLEIPLRLRKAAMEGDRFKQLVQRFSEMQARAGNESLEEADDFDVDDDGDLEFFSPHELTEMQEEGTFDASDVRTKRERVYGRRKGWDGRTERRRNAVDRGGVERAEGGDRPSVEQGDGAGSKSGAGGTPA